MASTELGEFLRARRAAASPDSVPFASAGPRRVPGLRRDEVAMLADVSPDYYRRLEQGRERHPSQAVLEGLSKAWFLLSRNVGTFIRWQVWRGDSTVPSFAGRSIPRYCV
ncbi:helix-turn-helix domain-containing protein [Rhodococcus sp. NPDC059968]|uniref:helix-turn-helix domain-containing protein n=1 Tax=Rhodococcus sp. NPDC059968 TaxID=3347017 RepID=UPI00366D3A8D